MKGPEMSICSRTGLSVPECSCPDCVQRMLAAFQPERYAEAEIRITRTASAPATGRRWRWRRRGA
jgi:hypothetical protein